MATTNCWAFFRWVPQGNGYGGWLGAVVLTLAVLGCSASAVAECARPIGVDPAVHLTVSIPKIEYRHDVDLMGLPSLTHSLESLPGKGRLLGLTVHGEGLRTRVEIRSYKTDPGPWCHWMTRVEGLLTVPELTVYIASNYPVGSCQYNVILEHENTHVSITRHVIATFTPQIEQALRDAVARINPVASPQRDASATINHFLENAMAPTMKSFFSELRRANGEIDTPENYRKTSLRCPSW